MIQSIGPHWAEYIAEKQPYPEAMWEDVEQYKKLLANEHCLVQ